MRQLQLPHHVKYLQVAGIGGKTHGVSHSMVSFHVVNSNIAGPPSGCCWKVESAALPKVTTKLPTRQSLSMLSGSTCRDYNWPTSDLVSQIV